MESVKIALYILAMLTSTGCAVLLARQYRLTGSSLLAWSALCFACLSINNVLLFADLVVFPHIDLRLYRHLATLAGLGFLLYGFIWEADR